MRLLSFVSDIEHSITAESPVVDGGAWDFARTVNFQQGLCRLTLAPRPAADLPFPSGTIFLQAFSLADGSQCLKATLSWKDSPVTTAMAVYSTPQLNWKLEASKIATAWMEGPPANAQAPNSLPTEGLTPLSATG
ncbi:hypothetical protein [Opitutus sp. ER46]|uniref:hypothetical protein n=1 Tax=Opitutus sp. ER46 TaxID=2161864 RepID=UPI000D3170A1|nr:hypothetical protein [Opitutus sp. ER46]PTX90882.1 hypothetical protein DB354_19720 [Opitutus sp. ER46]